jgi:hypothetical protein
MIRLLSSANGYNTESPEWLYIDFAKKAYRASNRKEYILQMIQWLGRQEAMHYFSSYLTWLQVHSVPDTYHDDDFSDNEDQDDEDNSDGDGNGNGNGKGKGSIEGDAEDRDDRDDSREVDDSNDLNQAQLIPCATRFHATEHIIAKHPPFPHMTVQTIV